MNVASILALVGDGILAAYCAAKGGVLGVTQATAVQYGSVGIRCNAICPGDIDTPLVQAYFDTAADPGCAAPAGRGRVSARTDRAAPARSRGPSSSSPRTTPRS